MMTENTGIIPEPETAPEEKPVWSGWATFGFGALIFFVYSVFQVIAIGAVLLWLYFSSYAPAAGAALDEIAETFYLVYSDHLGLMVSVGTAVSMVVSVGMILLLVRAKRGAAITEYLGLRPIGGRTVLGVLGVTLLFLLLSDALSSVLGRPLFPEEMAVTYETAVWLPFLWLAVVVFAPIAEEALFRGFLFEGFSRSRVGIIGAVGITACVWALLHVQYDWYGITTIFVMGILFGVVRYKTGSLWSTLMMHGFANLVAMFQVALNMDKLI